MKYKLLNVSMFVAIMHLNVFAQPRVGNQITIGGNAGDYLLYQSLTKDGGLIAGGYSESAISAEKTENSRGGTDYWIIKLDSNGHIQWDKTIGGNEDDVLNAIQQTSDGGYILGGYSESGISGEKTENSKGQDDYWVVKVDSIGNVQWDKTIGTPISEDLVSIQQTNDNGYILGGSSSSGIVGDKTESSRGDADYWIVKLDSQGQIQWDKTIGGSSYDAFKDIQQTSDDGYIISGYSYSNISGEKTENSKGNADYWIVKLDKFHNIQWDKTIGGSGADFLNTLEKTNDECYILAGQSFSNISGDKTENSRGEADYWIVKLSKQGRFRWDKTIGGNHDDNLHALQQTTDEGLVLGGTSESNISGEKTEDSYHGYDYWIVKLDKFRNIQWDKTIGGKAADILFSIKEIKKNHYALGGYSSSMLSGDKTEDSRGSFDYWLVNLIYEKTNTSKLEVTNNANYSSITENKSFTIYPNPVKNLLNVENKGKTTFTLTNALGKMLFAKTVNGNITINVSNLPAGLYYLKNVTTGEVKKVIVAK